MSYASQCSSFDAVILSLSKDEHRSLLVALGLIEYTIEELSKTHHQQNYSLRISAGDKNMSMKTLRKAIMLMEKYPKMMYFGGPQPASLIAKAEATLGVTFPPTYRHFLETYGAGSFGSTEIYGITDEDLTTGPIPNGIWCTLDERRVSELPPSLVIIASDGEGGWLCLVCRNEKDKEAPVIQYVPGMMPSKDDWLLAERDFGDFLLLVVREETRDQKLSTIKL